MYNIPDYPCDVEFAKSVEYILEPKDFLNFTHFALEYVEKEDKSLIKSPNELKFGGHQSLEEREKSFYARNQTLHCGFVKGPDGIETAGFDLDEKDKRYMSSCVIVVSSCIFGSSDFLRRPTSRLVSGVVQLVMRMIAVSLTLDHKCTGLVWLALSSNKILLPFSFDMLS